MSHIVNLAENVKPKVKAVNGHDCDFAWGAAAIGRIIGLTVRQAHHLLQNGQIKSARKVGGKWVANRTALLREFGGA
jgi:hypothetical protein